MIENGEVTQLLADLGHGSRDALDRVLPILCAELQRIAHCQLDGERADHTMAAGDLVHEAYLKLVGLDRIAWKNRAQLFAVAAPAFGREASRGTFQSFPKHPFLGAAEHPSFSP